MRSQCQTIAVCWTDSHDGVRDALYQQAPEYVAACGWYPLPQRVISSF